MSGLCCETRGIVTGALYPVPLFRAELRTRELFTKRIPPPPETLPAAIFGCFSL